MREAICTVNDCEWQSSETSDVHTERAWTDTSDTAIEECNICGFIRGSSRSDGRRRIRIIRVLESCEHVGELNLRGVGEIDSEGVMVCGNNRSAVNSVNDVANNSRRDSGTIVCGGSTSEFIEDDEGTTGGVIEKLSSFCHLHEQG